MALPQQHLPQHLPRPPLCSHARAKQGVEQQQMWIQHCQAHSRRKHLRLQPHQQQQQQEQEQEQQQEQEQEQEQEQAKWQPGEQASGREGPQWQQQRACEGRTASTPEEGRGGESCLDGERER